MHLRLNKMPVVNRMKDSNVTLRTMTEEDIPRMAELERIIFTDPWTEKVYRETFAIPGVEYVVAVEGDTIVGGAGVRNIVGTGEITNVMLLPEYRGRGIGKAIVKDAIERGKRLGATEFTLEVRVSNSRAIGLYESLGFVSEGIRPGFYNNPKEDAGIYWIR